MIDSFLSELVPLLQGVTVQPILGEIPIMMWIVVPLIVIALLLGSLSKLPGVKGTIGEGIVNRTVLGRLDRTHYSVFHDLYLPRPDGRGDTQIDHVVVSQFGIFVIETKNMTGWIFGDETSRSWTQTIYRKKYRFQNPLHQNALHIGALSKHLGLPKSQFHNLVFFIGDAELKTKLPANVATRGLSCTDLSARDTGFNCRSGGANQPGSERYSVQRGQEGHEASPCLRLQTAQYFFLMTCAVGGTEEREVLLRM